jgi:hypothetical protein
MLMTQVQWVLKVKMEQGCSSTRRPKFTVICGTGPVSVLIHKIYTLISTK